MTIAICFGQFGPYHHARVSALQKLAHEQGVRALPVQIAASTTTYGWAATDSCEGLHTLCTGTDEAASPLEVFLKARKIFREEKVDVAFLPSYSPARFFALFAAAKSLGIRTVMMNESHAGTEQATGWKRWIKRQIVKRFDAALVGGEPHKRHFASLGIPAEKIFTGYDAVDNAYLTAKADEVRSMEHGAWSRDGETKAEAGDLKPEVGQTERRSMREAYGLPERYFLSLGRMVGKKNLATLVGAYAKFCDGSRGLARQPLGNRVTSDGAARQTPASLVFVGSGELEGTLKEQARDLGLTVIDHSSWKAGESSETRDQQLATRDEENRGTVFFYGFRQIEENAVFYALAEAFVLPSLYEEWGLVVNEAMAAGLPVIVSRTAGCAEDLVPSSGNMERGAWSMEQEADVRAARPYLEQRSNGFAFDPALSDALATALTRVAESEDLRLEMGQRSREIVAKFSCDNFARQAMRAAKAATP